MTPTLSGRGTLGRRGDFRLANVCRLVRVEEPDRLWLPAAAADGLCPR